MSRRSRACRTTLLVAVAAGLSACSGAAIDPPDLATSALKLPVEAASAGACAGALVGSEDVTVENVLAPARQKAVDGREGEAAKAQAAVSQSAGAAARDCPPAVVVATPVQQRAAKPEAAGPGNPALNAELTIDFNEAGHGLGETEKQAIAAAGKAHKSTGGKEIRIAAGPGSNGNPFDQVAEAQKRAKLVSGLLPRGMAVVSEYDPNQDEDTVRIEFVHKS